MANRSSGRDSFPLHVRPSSQRRRANRSSDEDPKLPHDVAVEVLKRLPVESLLRCRCVCRSWLKTIDDPRFVALHLSHSALDASNWYLLCLDWRNPVQNLFSLLSHESLALPSRSQVEIPFVTPPERYGVVGSWDGLICITEYSGDGYGQTMCLWNLFTRKHEAVRRPGRQFLFEETPYEALGFGFDARSNDYKIVRVLCFSDDDINRTKPRVETYSLRTDSWSSLEREVPALCRSRPAVFLKGNLHWFVIKSDYMLAGRGYGSIVSFDIAGEVFDEMAPPEQTFNVDSGGGGLAVSAAVLNDLLAVFINLTQPLHPEPHSVCSVWVMREYGVPQSWAKLHTSEVCGEVAGFDGFTRNGELLMEMDGGERVSWDPITSQFTNLPLSTECDLVAVVESLVSL